MSRKLLSLYGLKWNPFTPDIPVEALLRTPRIESFMIRMEHLARDGGFALVTGAPGTGKSVTLRILREHFSHIREMRVGVLTRPQCNVPDLYRELGDLFGVGLSPHNRWAGTKVLRERWRVFAEAALFRPVLLIDEAQEMTPTVINEIRILMSTELDSRQLLCVVFTGDGRLVARLGHDDLLPLSSRIRIRLAFESASAEELAQVLRHALEQAGNPRLMTDELVKTLCDHAAGNLRVLMGMSDQLLQMAAEQEAERLDEKLFFTTFDLTPPRRGRRGGGQK